MWKQIAHVKETKLVTLKKQMALLLNSEGYGCQWKAVADQPDTRTGGKKEETRKLMLKSAV